MLLTLKQTDRHGKASSIFVSDNVLFSLMSPWAGAHVQSIKICLGVPPQEYVGSHLATP